MRSILRAIPIRSLLPRAAALLALAAAVPAFAQADGRASADPSGIQVTASLRELRVVFPRDTAKAWGWSGDRRPGSFPFYLWAVTANGLGGPERLSLSTIRLNDQARTFPSLDSLVAAGELMLCAGFSCTADGVEARVEDGRVTLLVRDSAAIARWMGLRPDRVRVEADRPGEADADRTVRVDYVAPWIPVPSAEVRERAERTRRADERKRHHLTRSIVGGRLSSSPDLWMAVGDTARLEVQDALWTQRNIGRSEVVEGGRWSVADAGVARLREDRATGGRTITGVRPGRTRVRVSGLPGVRDTMLSHDTVPRELAREVVVTLPIARVEMSVPPTVTMHDMLEVRPAVYDRAGGRIENAPVILRIGMSWQVMARDGLFRWMFTEPGRYTVVASFGGVSATAEVTVLPLPPG